MDDEHLIERQLRVIETINDCLIIDHWNNEYNRFYFKT
jgi:hypothetical protein